MDDLRINEEGIYIRIANEKTTAANCTFQRSVRLSMSTVAFLEILIIGDTLRLDPLQVCALI